MQIFSSNSSILTKELSTLCVSGKVSEIFPHSSPAFPESGVGAGTNMVQVPQRAPGKPGWAARQLVCSKC